MSEVISGDSHVNEPAFWSEFIDAKYRDRAPRLVRKGNTDLYVCEGAHLPPIGVPGSAGRAKETIRPEGFFEEVVPKAAWDPDERLKAMDVDSSAIEVLYPTVGLRLNHLQDMDFQAACFRAYNTWLAELCATHPKRIKGVGLLSLGNIPEAIKELERVRKLGLVGGHISYSLVDIHLDHYGRPYYEPLWAAAEDLDIPIVLHIGSERHWRRGFLNSLSTAMGAGIRESLTAMVLSGVFERHPKLKVASVENRVSWVPAWLDRIDAMATAETFFMDPEPEFDFSKLKMLPSEYIKRQVWHTTLMPDYDWIPLRDKVGIDRVMWSNDYPHREATWPNSIQTIEEVFKDFSKEEMEKLLSTNAANLHGLN